MTEVQPCTPGVARIIFFHFLRRRGGPLQRGRIGELQAHVT